MKTKYLYITYFFVFLITYACVKPFNYENIDYEKALVIDGLITNEKKAHTVKINYSAPLDFNENIPVTGASVYIEITDGSSILLYEESPGVYKTMADVEGIPGKGYTLNINLPNGETYKSTTEILHSPIAIDSIYHQYAEIINESSGINEPGIQFFIDSHDDTGESRYFRYEWEEAYRIQVPYPSYYDFDYPTDTYFYRTESVGTCYSSGQSYNLIIGNSLNNTQNRIVELPILFVSGDSYKIRNRYTLLVKQYSISQKAYTYYKQLKESNETGGFLFDKQLGSILGNVVNTQNPSESVLGFFEVSSIIEQRRFYNLRDLDKQIGVPPNKYKCELSSEILTTNDSIAYYMNVDKSLRIIGLQSMASPAKLMSRECSDCSWYATTTKPDFWID